MTESRVLELFAECGALLTGHFRLSSGLHSDRYLEKFRLVEKPSVFDPMASALADMLSAAKPEYVLGPTTAGIIIAYCVARNLGVEARYAESVEGGRDLRRGQTLPEGARVVIVDDILTTGLSVRECIEVVERHQAIVAGIGVLADRSGGKARFDAPLSAMVTLDVPAYEPDLCPLCAAGVPITQRGSRRPS